PLVRPRFAPTAVGGYGRFLPACVLGHRAGRVRPSRCAFWPEWPLYQSNLPTRMTCLSLRPGWTSSLSNSLRNTRSRATLLLLLAGCLTAPAADWPQYRGPEGSGVTSEKISSTWPDAGPRQLWKTPLNSGFSSFAVAGDRAFTLV